MRNIKSTLGLGLVALRQVIATNTTVLLPPPTGPYAVGASKHVIPFYAENDPVAPGGIQTEYLATVYYPTLDKPCKPVPYLDPEEAELWTAGVGIAPGMLASLTMMVKWNASYLPGPVGESPYPTILFGPGGTGPSSDCYVTLITELVSHGYTVAALDHVYEQPWIRFPNGTAVIGLPLDVVITPELAADLGRVRVADNVHFVSVWSDLVQELKAPFNTTVLGAFGHSLGGTAAVSVAIDSDIVLSALNMDGGYQGKPAADGPEADVGKPVLQLGQEAHLDIDPTWLVFPKWQTGWWRTILINETVHLDFSDIAFWRTQDKNLPGGAIDGLRVIDVVRAYTKAFFDETLLGKEQPILDGPSSDYPEVVVAAGSGI